MPKTKKPAEITIDEAMPRLNVTTRQAVAYMIKTGKLPGARKLNPAKRGSPWVIPQESVEAYEQEIAEAEKAAARK